MALYTLEVYWCGDHCCQKYSKYWIDQLYIYGIPGLGGRIHIAASAMGKRIESSGGKLRL